ncbi:MAG: hypothetical protein GC191_19885 [Azospirillum sp.]|nr:hypothetical protein [Azospirillum sp.]
MLLLLVISGLPLACTWDRYRPVPTDPVQSVYRAGVPQTDRSGRRLAQFDPARSFLPIGIYHGVTGTWFQRTHSFAELAAAGFNAVHSWEGVPLAQAVEAAGRHGLGLVFHYPSDAGIAGFADDSRVLAWYLDEEPNLMFSVAEQREQLAGFRRRYHEIRRQDARHPIFALDYPAFIGERRPFWRSWAAVGDVSAHDNYPIRWGRIDTLDNATGIPSSVRLAVESTGESRPVWVFLQAMASPAHGWRMPTPEELRAMVYAALIHGATGVFYFAYDSFVTREGNVLGMAPEPEADYGPTPGFGSGGPGLKAGPADRAGARRLWAAATEINAELRALTPDLLSPTSVLTPRVELSGTPVSATPIRLLIKPHGDALTVLAVNLDRRRLTATIAFDQPLAAVSRLFRPGDPPVRPDVTAWQEQFEPFGVVVYRVSLAGSGS